MSTQKLTCESDLNYWIETEQLQVGTNGKYECRGITKPKSYPCILVWSWYEDSSSKDWLSHSYIYQSDFNE